VRRLWNSPARNLIAAVGFVLAVSALAVAGYVHAGWTAGDALYMTVLTVFTVGFDEVRPIDTGFLRGLTIGLIAFGCTGMIVVTGTLVQYVTVTQIQQALGLRRMSTEIDKLRDHVIVCGFGRIGQMLCRELRAAGVRFVVLERSEARFEQARALGHLAINADATEEEALARAGIVRARTLATVLPDDSANVFITLSARSLARGLVIIARGEAPSTETKLRHAGANEVVLPAHIGAERVAELVLYPGGVGASRQLPGIRMMEAELRRMGLELETVVAERGGLAGLTVDEVERRGDRAFFVVAIERQGGRDTQRPDGATMIEPGDGVMIVGRGGRARMLEAFAAEAE
jgi:Trk K+ transport system NAD-binding subunit